MKLIMQFAFLFILLINSSVVVLAQTDNESSRATLRGIKSIYVNVSTIEDKKLIENGITSQQIITDIELKLRMAGINVVETLNEQTNDGEPNLHLEIIILEQNDYIFVYSLSLEFRQLVTPVRKGKIIAMGTTWKNDLVGYIGVQNSSKIRDYVKDLVDSFINSYLAVNKNK